MKKVFYVVKNVAVVVLVCCFIEFLLSSSFEFKTVKNDFGYTMTSEDVQKDFFDSSVFNTMIGNKVSDIAYYGAMTLELQDVPKNQRSLSANELGFGNGYDDTVSKMSKLYNKGNTNLNYFILSQTQEATSVFSNTESSYTECEKLKALILDMADKYIYYDSSEDEYETNLDIEKSTFKALLEKNSAYYGDNYCFMVGVQKDLPIDDDIKTAFETYDSFKSNFALNMTMILVCSFVIIGSVLYLTFVEFASAKKDMDKHPTDNLAFEIRILIGLLWIVMYSVMIDSMDSMAQLIIDLRSKSLIGYYASIGTIALVSILILDFLYFAAIRRLSNGLLWRTSYIVRFVKYIVGCIRNLVDNWKLTIRYVLLMSALLIFNILCGLSCNNLPVILLPMFIVDGFSVFYVYSRAKERVGIINVVKKIARGDLEASVNVEEVHGENTAIAESVNSIRQAVNTAVEQSLKDEKMKADLITNVSHDLKTPLTSIINYVDLLKKENITDMPAAEYIEIIDSKSQRLKKMTEDLIEASKISSGNITLNIEKIDIKELIAQAIGEFSDRFGAKSLGIVQNGFDEPRFIMADSGSLFRVMENLFINICKYSLEGTRVYIDIKNVDRKVEVLIKNISNTQLDIKTDDLLERFVRGEQSRTTEGSGLGLPIAKSLIDAMGGKFELAVDGDLFKVKLLFDLI